MGGARQEESAWEKKKSFSNCMAIYHSTADVPTAIYFRKELLERVTWQITSIWQEQLFLKQVYIYSNWDFEQNFKSSST